MIKPRASAWVGLEGGRKRREGKRKRKRRDEREEEARGEDREKQTLGDLILKVGHLDPGKGREWKVIKKKEISSFNYLPFSDILSLSLPFPLFPFFFFFTFPSFNAANQERKSHSDEH